MLKRRLLIAQGPQQLLLGIACLRERAKGSDALFEDVLMLGDFMAPEVAASMDRTCRIIATQHPFCAIHSTHEWDAKFYKKECLLAEYMAGVLRCIGCTGFDELIVTRNMQSLNEVILHSFPKAWKITTGDGLGVIDNHSIRFAQPILPTGYLPVDELQSLLPVEAEPGLFNGMPVGRIKPGHYKDAIRMAATALDMASLMARHDPAILHSPTTLLLMANLTESGHAACVDDELRYFIESALPYLEPGSRVWVKGHPRHTQGQPAMLTQCLRGLGFTAHSDPVIDTMPSECMAMSIPVSRLLAFHSSTCISWRLLNPETPLVIGAPQSIAEKYLRTPQAFRTGVAGRFIQTMMLSLGRYDPLSREAIKAVQERVTGWVADIAPASQCHTPEIAALLDEVVGTSAQNFASTVAQSASRHPRQEVNKREAAILAILRCECCLGERTRALELVEENIGAAEQGSVKLQAQHTKLASRAERLAGELQHIHSTLAWRCLKWLFKLEWFIRRR